MISFSIANIKYVIDEPCIESICIFGSFSRGEADSLSDIDILVLINNNDNLEAIDMKISLSKKMNVPLEWLSIYNVSTFEQMAHKGSYFLWHLKLEGKIVYSKTNKLNEILDSLNEYTGIQNDLEEYIVICNDIRDSIKMGKFTLNYELSLLASIIRNTCIAIAYMDKKYLFGRVAPVEYCLNHLHTAHLFDINEYVNLYYYRIYYIRSLKVDGLTDGTLSMVEYWIDNAMKLLDYGIIKLKGSESNVE